jgi:type II secretory pathway pseudopilin PulG
VTTVTYRRKVEAFSLVEVVLALGVFVFAGFALTGLLSVGLQSSRDSNEQLQAANIAEFICSTRRAVPTTDLSTLQPNFPLPALTNSVTTPTTVGLTWDGMQTPFITDPTARFGLIYTIIPTLYPVPAGNTSTGVSTVYLCLYWPAHASPTNAANGHFEVTTTFALP